MKAVKDIFENGWMRFDTWHTAGQSDIKRFHQDIKTILDTVSGSLSFAEFKTAIMQVVSDKYSEHNQKYMEEVVKSFALKAETIANYHYDIS